MKLCADTISYTLEQLFPYSGPSSRVTCPHGYGLWCCPFVATGLCSGKTAQADRKEKS
jgi:hypothetical protein